MQGKFICIPKDPWSIDVQLAPLNQRAWVFQERHLARRTLHFAADQIYWECNELESSERHYKERLEETVVDHTGVPYKTRRNLARCVQKNGRWEGTPISLWYSIVVEYARTSITKRSDRLVALSGFARQFKDSLENDQYLAGHWRSSLPHSLFWIRDEDVKSQCTDEYIAPSWSWASGTAAIGFHRIDFEIAIDALEVLEARTTPPGDAFGPVSGGHIRIRGLLSLALIQKID